MRKFLVLAAVFALTACAGVAVHNPVQDLETSLGTAEASAQVYVKLKPCSPTSGPICSKFSVVQTIEDSRKAARVAVDAARKAQTAADLQDKLALGQAAVDGFNGIINSDVVQKALKGN